MQRRHVRARIDELMAREHLCRAGSLALALLVVTTACSRSGNQAVQALQPAHAPAAAADRSSFPMEEQIGWFHGRCLALTNAQFAQGAPMWLVLTNDPQTVIAAKLGSATSSADTCKPLLDDRVEENTKPGVVFYSVEAANLQPTDMGIGIVGSSARPEIVNGRARVDFEKGGHTVVFSSCTTTEGVRFAMWNDTPYQGEPRWSGYYYLGYESPPNCPQ